MPGINKVMLLGHLRIDPDFKWMDGNVPFITFLLGTSEHINKNGTKIEQTELHQIIMWRELAETAAKQLKKGKLIYVEGKVKTRSFIDQAGIKRYTTEVVADTFKLLESVQDFSTKTVNVF